MHLKLSERKKERDIRFILILNNENLLLNKDDTPQQATLLKGNDKFILETIDDDEDESAKNEVRPNESSKNKNTFSKEAPCRAAPDGCSIDPTHLGESYRMRREKRKREVADEKEPQDVNYPYRPVLRPVVYESLSNKKIKLI